MRLRHAAEIIASKGHCNRRAGLDHGAEVLYTGRRAAGSIYLGRLPLICASSAAVHALPSAHAVGEFPEHIDVAVVPGGLLGEMEKDPSQRDRFGSPAQFAP